VHTYTQKKKKKTGVCVVGSGPQPIGLQVVVGRRRSRRRRAPPSSWGERRSSVGVSVCRWSSLMATFAWYSIKAIGRRVSAWRDSSICSTSQEPDRIQYRCAPATIG